MILKRIQWLWIAGLLAGTGLSATGGEFAPPAEGPVAFRRDKIPLDPDAMATLSKQLETLARGASGETPAERRGAAQMLALALALDPANMRARELVAEYQENRHKPGVEADRLEKSRARIWQDIVWLETPDAGSQGQALAACLKDVIVIADPKDPRAASMREGGEKGAWAGWIPALSAYESKAVVKNNGPENPDPAVVPVPKNEVPLAMAHVQTLLWQKSGKDDSAGWVLATAPLEMSAQKTGKDQSGEHPFSIVIGSGDNAGTFAPISISLQKLLKTQHDTLPQGVRVTITSKELEKSVESKKRQSISAAAAVLASAAVTGCEPDAIILGLVDESGAYKLSTGFWDQLQALGKGNGQRLMLPAEAAPYLSSILALERPGFFMEYEVMTAADFKQLLALSAKVPEGTLDAATAKFREIRERAGTQDVRQYIGNTFVKQRLASVLQDAPTHISAKMLLIQAAGNRPTLVARAVLAAELRRALEPMVWIVKDPSHEFSSTDANKLGQTYEACRSRVDALERYTDKPDRSLVEHVRELVVSVRNLDRATRSRGDYSVVAAASAAALGELNRIAKSVRDELDTESGEVQPSGNR